MSESQPQPRRRVARESGAAKRELDHFAETQGIVTSASAPFGALPQHSAGYAAIVERVFDLPDPDAEYQILEESLSVGSSNFDSISAALDTAEDNARRAHKLYVNARVDAERFNIDADVIESAMRTQAIAELQREKDAGLRSKQITDTDATAKVSAMFPDEYRDLADRRVKSRKMIEHVEAFAGLWRSRCYSLSKMLESKR